MLSHLAVCTDGIWLGTSVMILFHRNPLVAAKTVSTLDVLSNGRRSASCKGTGPAIGSS